MLDSTTIAKPPMTIASNLKMLKRRKWTEIAYQCQDFTGLVWHWHLDHADTEKLWAAEKAGLIYVSQKRIDLYDYSLVAMTSLEWERGERA